MYHHCSFRHFITKNTIVSPFHISKTGLPHHLCERRDERSRSASSNRGATELRQPLCVMVSQQCGTGVWWSDGIHRLTAKEIPHSSNKGEMSHTSIPTAKFQNQTTVMWQQVAPSAMWCNEEKDAKFVHGKVAVILPVPLICHTPKKTARARQLLNLMGNDYVTRCRAKNFNKNKKSWNLMRKSHCISPTNWYQLTPQKTASLTTSEGQVGSASNWWRFCGHVI